MKMAINNLPLRLRSPQRYRSTRRQRRRHYQLDLVITGTKVIAQRTGTDKRLEAQFLPDFRKTIVNRAAPGNLPDLGKDKARAGKNTAGLRLQSDYIPPESSPRTANH